MGTVTRLTGGYWFGRDHLMKMWSRADHDIIFHCGLHKVYVPVHGFFVFFLWSLVTRELLDGPGWVCETKNSWGIKKNSWWAGAVQIYGLSSIYPHITTYRWVSVSRHIGSRGGTSRWVPVQYHFWTLL